MDIHKHLGFENITNMDFSPVLISLMNNFMAQEGNEVYENMEYLQLDITDIEEALKVEQIEMDTYNVIIDKACLDCVACSEDDSKLQTSIDNIHSILMPGGFFFMVSRGSPDQRCHLFESDQEEPEASEVADDDDERYGTAHYGGFQ
jgi:SAM-dependent methyltransferase